VNPVPSLERFLVAIIRWINLSLLQVGLAPLYKQWLGDFADEPVRVEQVGVGESDAVVC
jgi:hypothetical protein